MSELDEIRQRKIMEMHQRQNEDIQEEMQLQQQIAQLESVVKQALTKEALERFGNLKAAYPEKAVQVLVVLGQLIQSGKINKIDDGQLKELLSTIATRKKDFKIRIK